jgi:hypothetical protein
LAGAHRANKGVSILPFVRKAGTVFDDNATKVMGEAFDSACKELHDKGQPEIVCEVITRHIIDAAKKGERGPIQLRKAGLKALGLDSEGKWTRYPPRLVASLLFASVASRIPSPKETAPARG